MGPKIHIKLISNGTKMGPPSMVPFGSVWPTLSTKTLKTDPFETRFGPVWSRFIDENIETPISYVPSIKETHTPVKKHSHIYIYVTPRDTDKREGGDIIYRLYLSWGGTPP